MPRQSTSRRLRRRGGLAVLAACTTAALAPPAAHATHVAGATYDGTHDGGGSGSLTVSPDGSQVDSFNVNNVAGNGCTIDSFGISNANIPIDANHSFDLSSPDGSFVRGTFAGERSASGTFRIVRPAGPSSPACDTGTRQWSATTTEAEPQLEQASCRRSGRYRGSTSQRLPICFTFSGRRRRITEFEFNWRGDCAGGTAESLTQLGRRGLPRVDRTGRFRVSGSTLSISGRVTRRSARGTFEISISGGVGTCRSGLVRWSARRR